MFCMRQIISFHALGGGCFPTTRLRFWFGLLCRDEQADDRSSWTSTQPVLSSTRGRHSNLIWKAGRGKTSMRKPIRFGSQSHMYAPRSRKSIIFPYSCSSDGSMLCLHATGFVQSLVRQGKKQYVGTLVALTNTSRLQVT